MFLVRYVSLQKIAKCGHEKAKYIWLKIKVYPKYTILLFESWVISCWCLYYKSKANFRQNMTYSFLHMNNGFHNITLSLVMTQVIFAQLKALGCAIPICDLLLCLLLAFASQKQGFLIMSLRLFIGSCSHELSFVRRCSCRLWMFLQVILFAETRYFVQICTYAISIGPWNI